MTPGTWGSDSAQPELTSIIIIEILYLIQLDFSWIKHYKEHYTNILRNKTSFSAAEYTLPGHCLTLNREGVECQVLEGFSITLVLECPNHNHTHLQTFQQVIKSFVWFLSAHWVKAPHQQPRYSTGTSSQALKFSVVCVHKWKGRWVMITNCSWLNRSVQGNM